MLKSKLVAGLVLWALSGVAIAIPVTISNTSNFREYRYDPPPGFVQGPDLILLSGQLDVFAGTSVSGTNSNTGEVVNFPITPGAFGGDFFAFLPYSAATAIGDWTFEATNGGDTTSVVVPAFGTGPGTGILPGVGSLAATGTTAPTVSWTLPAGLPSANDGNVDRLRVRITDEFGSTLFDSRSTLGESLPLNLTSYDVPGGYLTGPGNYVAQVLVEGFNPFIRSRTFHPFQVPEPLTFALLGLGLAAVGMTRGRRIKP